jgi:hypothetical protein
MARLSTQRRILRAALCLIVVLPCMLLASVATAKASAGSHSPAVLRLAFRKHGRAVALVSNQRFAFAPRGALNASGQLFDDVAHTSRTVPQEGCGFTGSEIFGNVLAFDCERSRQTPPRLYSITSRTWTTVSPNPALTRSCGPYDNCTATLTDAGSEWLEFSRSVCPMDEHCSSTNLFQNTHTGELLPDPATQGGHERADLDSPHLAQPICPPGTVPAGLNLFTAPGPGLLRFEGRFAVTTGARLKGGSATYLERCGSNLHQLIESNNAALEPGPLAASPRAIVWLQTPPALHIEFLPSRRRFATQLPRTASAVLALALTINRLYAIDQANTLWIAPLPRKPPAITRPQQRG